MENHSGDTALEITKLERICNDDRARRELLWLRAQERDDAMSLAALELADPDLRGRMSRLVHQRGVDAILDPGRRREAFGRLWDEHFAAL